MDHAATMRRMYDLLNAGDPREGVWKLRERNHLAGTTIAPGQLLRLP